LFARCLLDRETDVIDLSINKLACDEQLLKINQKINQANVFLEQSLFYEYISEHLIQRYQLAISQWLQRARGLTLDSEHILPVPSCQYAIHFIFSKLLKRGDVIIVEQYTAPGIISAAKALGLRLFSCKCDEQGLVPESLRSLIKQTGASTLITVPSNQSPMGTTQCEMRRQSLADIIIAEDLLVIEEDIYGMFAKPVPLAHFAPKHTLLLSGFSKCLSGGHKAAFIASKHPILKKLSELVVETVWLVSSSATSHIISAIENHYLDAAIKHISLRTQQKNAILNKILNLDLCLTNPHHWVKSSHEFIEGAARSGVLLAHSDNFAVSSSKSLDVYYRMSTNSVDLKKVKKAAIILSSIDTL
jgi:DNA-binding transcriptional MocR family regulator